MNRMIIFFLLFFAIPGFAMAKKGSSLICKQQALKEASRLLSFYRDNDDRTSISNVVTPIDKLRNPSNKNQFFDVLEVWGNVYKGQYRMRLIYSSELNCLLMGEEILEYSSL